MTMMRRAPHLHLLSLGSFGLICLLDVTLVLRPSSGWPLSPSSDCRRALFPLRRGGSENGHVHHHWPLVLGRRPPPFYSGTQQQQWCRDFLFSNCHPRRKTKVRMTPSDDDSEEGGEGQHIHFDDFGDRVIGSSGDVVDEESGDKSSSSASPASLSSQLRAAVEQQESRRLENWQKGNWQVRGISLDPDSAAGDGDERKIHVCLVASDPTSSSRVWIGRTDGSLLAVQLGDDYVTKFRSQLSATYDDASGTAQVSSILVNDDNSPAPGDDDDDDDDANVRRNTGASSASPFELLYQGSAGSSPVSCVLVANNNDETMYSACCDSGDIQQWVVEELDEDQLQLVRRATLSGAHGAGSTVLLLRHVRFEGKGAGLVSVARDGSVGLWDAGSGTIRSRFQIDAGDPDQQTAFVRAADCDGTNLFVGTAQGQVLAYSLRDLLKGERTTVDPNPSGKWTASMDHAVTAIACGGPGLLGMGSASATPTTTLFTGDGAGIVKQWEVLTRPGSTDEGDSATVTTGTRLEPWPRLPTQRLQKRAHVFQSMHTDAVTGLLSVDSHKVLSASEDGSVVAWNPATGKSFFFLDGFEKDIRSLCVQENLLVTDGMRHLVCVHDFNVESDIPDDDDWDRFEVDR